MMLYLYDEQGAPIRLMYRTSQYAADVYDGFFFEKNYFGDIVAMKKIFKTKKQLIITILIVFTIIQIISVIFFMIPRYRELFEDHWYHEFVDNIAIAYVQEINPSDEKVFVEGYYKYDIDDEIQKKNRGNENKEFPFTHIEVHVEKGKWTYIIYIKKDDAGKLYVHDYELQLGT